KQDKRDARRFDRHEDAGLSDEFSAYNDMLRKLAERDGVVAADSESDAAADSVASSADSSAEAGPETAANTPAGSANSAASSAAKPRGGRCTPYASRCRGGRTRTTQRTRNGTSGQPGQVVGPIRCGISIMPSMYASLRPRPSQTMIPALIGKSTQTINRLIS